MSFILIGLGITTLPFLYSGIVSGIVSLTSSIRNSIEDLRYEANYYMVTKKKENLMKKLHDLNMKQREDFLNQEIRNEITEVRKELQELKF